MEIDATSQYDGDHVALTAHQIPPGLKETDYILPDIIIRSHFHQDF